MNDPRVEQAEQMRLHFLGWQCRIRQLCIRHEGGRPSSGMRPEVRVDGRSLGPITVLINKAEPEKITAEFRFMVKKTVDPAERYENAIKLLSAAYYQRPHEFAEQLTGLFGPGSELARHLLERRQCELDFEQFAQRYRLPCRVVSLVEADAGYQATFWHNALFNPAIPADVTVLGFEPDWAHGVAEPAVP